MSLAWQKVPAALQRHLLATPPEPTETISSWIDRNASLWCTRRTEFTSKVDLRLVGPCFDIDSFKGDRRREDWLAAFGLGPTFLDPNRIERPDHCLAPNDRLSYCPLCMCSDMRGRVFPYFRSDWARFFLTHCPQHQCPLYQWGYVRFQGTRHFPHEWHLDQFDLEKSPFWFRRDVDEATQFANGTPPISSDASTLWNALVAFEARLLSDGVGTPGVGGEACRNQLLENQLLGICVLLLQFEGTDASIAPASVLRPAFEGHRLISFTRRTYRKGRKANTWMTVRKSLANLQCRRAVLVLAAQTLDLLGVPLSLVDGSSYEAGSGRWQERLKVEIGDARRWGLAIAGRINTTSSLRPWVAR